jgi:hypothetical protein
MHKRTQSRLMVLACLFMWGLSLYRAAWADEIVSITDEHGRKIFINAGETRAKSRLVAGTVQPAKADNASLPPPEINDLVEQTANRHQIDPQLVHAIIKVESEYDPKAVSAKGAMGLMQLIPETASRFGVENPFNPKENIEGGVSYLKYLLDLHLPIGATAVWHECCREQTAGFGHYPLCGWTRRGALFQCGMIRVNATWPSIIR